MLLHRIAPQCERYTAVDFSANALASVQAEVAAQGLTNVQLERLAAHDLAALKGSGPFDAIILNSVVQYFPDADYLAGVLRTAFDRLAPGGVIFLGDIRSLPHLGAFHTAIELARAGASTSTGDLRVRVRRRASEESELALDPRFFDVLTVQLGDAVVESIELKGGRRTTR